MRKASSSVVGAIGKTPVVRLSRIVESHGIHGVLLAKLEYLNPGFSKKDRIALQIIQDAEESGQLQPGGTLIEATSGNTGMAVASHENSVRILDIFSKNFHPCWK